MSSAWTLEAGPGGGGGGRPLAFQQGPPFSIFCLAWFKSVTSWSPRSSCPSLKLHWPAGGVYDKRKSAALGFLAAEWALFEMHPSMKLWNLAHRNARQVSQDIQREHLPGPRIRKFEGPRVQAGRKRVERDSDGFSGTLDRVPFASHFCLKSATRRTLHHFSCRCFARSSKQHVNSLRRGVHKLRTSGLGRHVPPLDCRKAGFAVRIKVVFRVSV